MVDGTPDPVAQGGEGRAETQFFGSGVRQVDVDRLDDAAQRQAADLGDVQIALHVTAIAAGSTVLSHVNDSGFWLVSRFFGMDEKTTLKTWTVMETLLGTIWFVLALVLSLFL